MQSAELFPFDGMELGALLSALWGRVPPDLHIEKLRAEASLRRYYRVNSAQCSPSPLLVMRLPESGPGAYVAGETFGFSNVQHYLRGLSLPVPEIYVDHAQKGLLAIEDLGDATLFARLQHTPRPLWRDHYRTAVRLLANLHARTANAPDSACVAFGRSFDRKLLGFELDHFREWGLDALGLAPNAAERALLDAQFGVILDALLALPQGFCHRDFQSRNLVWSKPDRLAMIDFQDALLGPFVYDLVALLCDSYVDLDAELQNDCIQHYADLRGMAYADVRRAFDLCCVQRKLKDAGRFVFIDRVRKNPDFLPAFGPSLIYVDRALAGLPQLAPLRALLAEKLAGYPEHVPTPASAIGLE
jgi:aminoglycoside/choline kinase family phosphotransferase